MKLATLLLLSVVAMLPQATPTTRSAPAVAQSDVLFIKVSSQPNISGLYDINPEGDIVMPLIKSVNAAGLTQNNWRT